jgi:hypothetical protein
MEILQIKRKSMTRFVRQFRVGDLDKSKCSAKFLTHNFSDDYVVNVKCMEDGTLDLRGNKQEYRILIPDSK